jgi:hypothetical protein
MADSKTPPALKKVEAKTAGEICAALELSEPARKLLDDQVSPAGFLARVSEAGLMPDAVRFLAHAMPKREAVWWACECVRAAALDSGDASKAALDSAARWAADPSEENRRAAEKAAGQAQSTPEGIVALAAFLSGGSMAPPEAQEVKPADDLTARSVAGAILLAAVARQPQQAPERYRRFLELGLDAANKPLPGGKGA